MKRSTLLTHAAAMLAMASGAAHADQLRVWEETVGPVPEFIVSLQGGQTVSFETVNLSEGADPVLHLWDLTFGVEIAMDDNSGGGKATALRARAPRAGNYALIVRQRNFVSSGTMDILRDGAAWRSNVLADGRYIFLMNLQAQEQVVALPPPQGSPTHHMYLISEDGLHIESRIAGRPRSRWQAPAGIFGARTMLLGVQHPQRGKPMRVYRNDALLRGADPDGDGLGVGLETQLKTCSYSTEAFDAFTCDRARDLRDTDSDGISDGWEVLGRDFSPTVYVALPTWGANPRHKDMFIEADYRRLTQAENDAQINQKMPASVAVAFADAYGDMNTTDPLIRLYHAALVGNPDQKPGISVHIDTGRAPESPAHAGIYGNWGGYSDIDAVMDANGNFGGQDPGALWKTHMHPSRRGIFRYGPGHMSGGGQCPVGSVFCGYNFNSASNAIHEMTHANALDHSGPDRIDPAAANCKANYPSVVNYAYAGNLLLSDGRNRPALNNTALKEWQAVAPSNTDYIADLQLVFKYLVDPANGHVDWNRDGVFAPAGTTVRAYSNYAPGNACEFTRVNQVTFGNTPATGTAIARVGNHSLLFWVDAAGVLRYRDSTSTWACGPTENNCAGSSFGSPIALSFGAPVLSFDAEPVKIDGVYQLSIVAITNDNRMRERRLLLQSNGSLTLSPTTLVLATGGVPAGEPSLAETRDGLGLYLVYKGTDNIVRWRFRNTQSWGPVIQATNEQGARLVTAPDASPGVAAGYLPSTPNSGAGVHLAFSDSDGILRFHTLNPNNQWARTNLLREFVSGSRGRPAMAWVPISTGLDAPGQFYVLYRDSGDIYKMMRTYFDQAAGGIRIGLLSDFDNPWLGGATIDVTASGSSGDVHLWAALAFTNGNGPNLIFRPRADGVVNVVQKNHDDWTAVSWAVCNYVVNPDGAQSNPIVCPARPWTPL